MICVMLKIATVQTNNNLVQSCFFQECKNLIGKVSYRSYQKHFPKNHKMHKVFNRNTVKEGYSCMKIIVSMI